MGQTLTNGIYLPDEGERNSYPGLEANWRTLDALILTINGKAAPNVANTWTAAQTFTAGIAGDLTGNVTGNVTGDLTGTASRAIADEDGTNIKSGYVNVAGNQTVSGDKSFTGSNTFNNILPNATNAYSLGSSSYQWSAVYAQTYYYNGTAWGLDQNNEWTGQNTFSSSNVAIKNSSATQGTPPSSNKTWTLSFTDTNNAVVGQLYCQYRANGTIYLPLRINNGTHDYRLNFILSSNGDSVFGPSVDNTMNLGTSTNKWKTLNGVNPGALSLPGKDNNIDITSEFTDLTGGDIYYIPPADGWISIKADNEIYCAVVSSTHRTVFWEQSASATSISRSCVTIPVKYSLHFLAKIKSTSSITATFYPCLGNV